MGPGAPGCEALESFSGPFTKQLSPVCFLHALRLAVVRDLGASWVLSPCCFPGDAGNRRGYQLGAVFTGCAFLLRSTV